MKSGRQLEMEPGAPYGDRDCRPPLPGRGVKLALVCALLAAGLIGSAIYLSRGVPGVAKEPKSHLVRGKQPSVPVPIPERREASLQWSARVTKAENHALAEGTPCQVRFDVVTNTVWFVSSAIEVWCGNRSLYSTKRLRPEDSTLRCRVVEGSSPPGERFEYHLRCWDKARGADHERFLLDTSQEMAAVWQERVPWRVELAVRRQDGIRKGEPIFEEPFTFVEPIRTRALVQSRKGEAPVEVGEECSVAIYPTRNPEYACRVHIRCGEKTLFGGFGQGYARCELEGGRPRTADDEKNTAADGDPVLRLELPANRITVSDEIPDYSLTLAIQPG